MKIKERKKKEKNDYRVKIFVVTRMTLQGRIRRMAEPISINLRLLILQTMKVLIGASLSEPHSNVENGTVVHARRTAAKNGIATHYCSLVQWFMYKQTR